MIEKYFSLRLLAVLLWWGATGQANATVLLKHLYINRGVLTTVHQTTFPWVAFNSTATFNQLNANINLNVKDTLILKIINTDSVKHVFSIRDYAGYLSLAINPNDSATDTLHFSSVQAYIFYDAYQYPTYKYLGAAGILSVTKNAPSAKEFYWNIKEHQSSYHQKLAQNIPVNWASYQPDYYTVNALSFPDLKDDTTNTWIHGKMGDTLYVFFANTGQTTHGIHLHGYHATIIYSKYSDQIGWIKDTFPLKPMEVIMVAIVPDKHGFYAVHDHNLLTNVGSNIHLKGILSFMTVTK